MRLESDMCTIYGSSSDLCGVFTSLIGRTKARLRLQATEATGRIFGKMGKAMHLPKPWVTGDTSAQPELRPPYLCGMLSL